MNRTIKIFLSATTVLTSGVVVNTPTQASANQDDDSGVIAGQYGASVQVDPSGGCDSGITINSGAVEDPDPGKVSSLVVEVGPSCDVRIVDQKRGVSESDTLPSESDASVEESLETSDSPATAEPTPLVLLGNYIRSSQTLQDIVFVDIAKWKWTHDRQWDEEFAATRFKLSGTCSPNNCWWGEASAPVSWNHAVDAVFDGADMTWCGLCVANSFSHGVFHSDFLWCNHQPGQDFFLNTTLDSMVNGGYDAHFSQSEVCSGTHLATSKSTSIEPPPF